MPLSTSPRTKAARANREGLDTGTPGAPRVLIVDDHKLFADAIRAALTVSGFDIVGIAGNGQQATELVRSTRPDLVLMDFGLPDGDGLLLGQDLLDEDPDLKILMVTALRDTKAVKKALRIGFSGYITKDTPVAQFVDSVRSALSGNVVMPRSLAPAATGAQTVAQREASLLVSQLTSRERKVLAVLAEGARSEEIAERLSISVNTVRTHVQNVLTKLQVRSRLEAVAFAVRHGIVEIPGDGRAVIDLNNS